MRAPVWLVGLSGAPFGFAAGIVFWATPQLLAARHVPEETIARLSGVMILPLVLGVFVAPVLDVRFSRRWYATVCCTVGTALMMAALVCLFSEEGLRVFGGLLFMGFLFLSLFNSALGGWEASVIASEDQASLSGWANVGNIGAGGVMAVVSMRLIRGVPLTAACAVMAGMMMLPMMVFLFMPAPGPDRRLARESFGGLLRAIASLFRRGEMIVVMVLFALPAASFTLTNLLGGLGADFHATERTVSLLNGGGVTLAGVMASLIGGRLCALVPLRWLYLGVGIVGAAFTLTMLAIPPSAAGYGIATLGENGFQALAFTVATAISLKTVGHDNALAATEMSLLWGAMNLPLFYMEFLEGRVYTLHGLRGALVVDAGISIAVCVGLAVVLGMRSRGMMTDARFRG